MTTTTTTRSAGGRAILESWEAERRAIRAALNRRQQARSIGLLTDAHAAERKAERDAARSTRATPTSTTTDLAMSRDIAAARRRDELTRSLAVPMTGAEVGDACTAACLAAKIPEAQREDLAQDLALAIYRRHGRDPLRVNVGRDWLRKLATVMHLAERRKHERATGARESAEQLGNWSKADAAPRFDPIAELTGADRVYALASNMSAREVRTAQSVATLSAEQVAKRLGSTLTQRQRDAMTAALSLTRIAPLTGAERQAWREARHVLRRWQSPEHIRRALRPDSYTAGQAVDATIRTLAGTLASDHIGAHGAHSSSTAPRVANLPKSAGMYPLRVTLRHSPNGESLTPNPS